MRAAQVSPWLEPNFTTQKSPRRQTSHWFRQDSPVTAFLSVGDIETSTTTPSSAFAAFWNHVTVTTLILMAVVKQTTTWAGMAMAAQIWAQLLYNDLSSAAFFPCWIVDDISSTTPAAVARWTLFRRTVRPNNNCALICKKIITVIYNLLTLVS